jgi:Arc/MetJ-type ribon-helix-helix transcriptional regulator
VGEGGYQSLDAYVNEVLRMLLAQERRRRLERSMEEASRDEKFLGDIERTMEDFKYADAETGRRMEEG